MVPQTPLLTGDVLKEENEQWQDVQQGMSLALREMRVDQVRVVLLLEISVFKTCHSYMDFQVSLVFYSNLFYMILGLRKKNFLESQYEFEYLSSIYEPNLR